MFKTHPEDIKSYRECFNDKSSDLRSCDNQYCIHEEKLGID